MELDAERRKKGKTIALVQVCGLCFLSVGRQTNKTVIQTEGTVDIFAQPNILVK